MCVLECEQEHAFYYVRLLSGARPPDDIDFYLCTVCTSASIPYAATSLKAMSVDLQCVVTVWCREPRSCKGCAHRPQTGPAREPAPGLA